MRCQHCDRTWTFDEAIDEDGICSDCGQPVVTCRFCGEFTVDADDPADYCDCLKAIDEETE
jgi:transcription initiation factor IIE alpha subunit